MGNFWIGPLRTQWEIRTICKIKTRELGVNRTHTFSFANNCRYPCNMPTTDMKTGKYCHSIASWGVSNVRFCKIKSKVFLDLNGVMGITPKKRGTIYHEMILARRWECLARCVGLLATTEPLLVEVTDSWTIRHREKHHEFRALC